MATPSPQPLGGFTLGSVGQHARPGTPVGASKKFPSSNSTSKHVSFASTPSTPQRTQSPTPVIASPYIQSPIPRNTINHQANTMSFQRVPLPAVPSTQTQPIQPNTNLPPPMVTAQYSPAIPKPSPVTPTINTPQPATFVPLPNSVPSPSPIQAQTPQPTYVPLNVHTPPPPQTLAQTQPTKTKFVSREDDPNIRNLIHEGLLKADCTIPEHMIPTGGKYDRVIASFINPTKRKRRSLIATPTTTTTTNNDPPPLFGSQFLPPRPTQSTTPPQSTIQPISTIQQKLPFIPTSTPTTSVTPSAAPTTPIPQVALSTPPSVPPSTQSSSMPNPLIPFLPLPPTQQSSPQVQQKQGGSDNSVPQPCGPLATNGLVPTWSSNVSIHLPTSELHGAEREAIERRKDQYIQNDLAMINDCFPGEIPFHELPPNASLARHADRNQFIFQRYMEIKQGEKFKNLCVRGVQLLDHALHTAKITDFFEDFDKKIDKQIGEDRFRKLQRDLNIVPNISPKFEMMMDFADLLLQQHKDRQKKTRKEGKTRREGFVNAAMGFAQTLRGKPVVTSPLITTNRQVVDEVKTSTRRTTTDSSTESDSETNDEDNESDEDVQPQKQTSRRQQYTPTRSVQMRPHQVTSQMRDTHRAHRTEEQFLQSIDSVTSHVQKSPPPPPPPPIAKREERGRDASRKRHKRHHSRRSPSPSPSHSPAPSSPTSQSQVHPQTEWKPGQEPDRESKHKPIERSKVVDGPPTDVLEL